MKAILTILPLLLLQLQSAFIDVPGVPERPATAAMCCCCGTAPTGACGCAACPGERPANDQPPRTTSAICCPCAVVPATPPEAPQTRVAPPRAGDGVVADRPAAPACGERIHDIRACAHGPPPDLPSAQSTVQLI